MGNIIRLVQDSLHQGLVLSAMQASPRIQLVVNDKSIASTLLITSQCVHVAQARVTKLNSTPGKSCKLGLGG